MVAGVPGVIVGLIIAVVEFVVGVYAIGKVREIARGQYLPGVPYRTAAPGPIGPGLSMRAPAYMG